MPNTTMQAPSGALPRMWVPASIPGSSSENAVAASIMPAAIPISVSARRCGMVRSKSAGNAPRAVVRKPAVPPYRASTSAREGPPSFSETRLSASRKHTASTPIASPPATSGCARTCSRHETLEVGCALATPVVLICRGSPRVSPCAAKLRWAVRSSAQDPYASSVDARGSLAKPQACDSADHMPTTEAETGSAPRLACLYHVDHVDAAVMHGVP
jgi:hypothetical protein